MRVFEARCQRKSAEVRKKSCCSVADGCQGRPPPPLPISRVLDLPSGSARLPSGKRVCISGFELLFTLVEMLAPIRQQMEGKKKVWL